MNFAPLPYLDPGSQSILWQMVIAVLLGLGVALRASWSKIKKIFGVKTQPKDEDDGDEDAEN